MHKKIIIIAGIIVIGAAIAWYSLPHKQEPIVKQLPPVQQPAQAAPKTATFSWSYADAGEDDGISKTKVTLTATYSDGTKTAKDIATVEGSCNDYAKPDADVYEHSTMIICYAAGFGDYFKVIKTADGYAVQRKEFAEASPDYNPPQQPFKTVVTF